MGFFHRRFLCLHTWSSNLPVQVKYRSQYTRKVQSRLSFIPKQKAVLNLERGNHSQPDGHFKISLASLPVVVSSRLYYILYQHNCTRQQSYHSLHCTAVQLQIIFLLVLGWMQICELLTFTPFFGFPGH